TYIGLNETKITDAGMKELAKFPQLSWLSISKTQVTADGLKHLGQIKNLERLFIAPAQIDDASFRVLIDLGLLRTLGLTDASRVSPKTDAEIVRLELTETKVTDAIIKDLARLTDLEELSLAPA